MIEVGLRLYPFLPFSKRGTCKFVPQTCKIKIISCAGRAAKYYSVLHSIFPYCTCFPYYKFLFHSIKDRSVPFQTRACHSMLQGVTPYKGPAINDGFVQSSMLAYPQTFRFTRVIPCDGTYVEFKRLSLEDRHFELQGFERWVCKKIVWHSLHGWQVR